MTRETTTKAPAKGTAKKATTKAAAGVPKKTTKAAAGVPKKATKAAVKKTTAKTTAKKTTTKAAAKTTAVRARDLPVLDGEKPWTSAELAEVTHDLESDVAKLRSELDLAEVGLAGLMRDASDQSGDDEADTGAKTFEREQEISLANNSRDLLEQSLHALQRIETGSYGGCESCGNPVGKLRLQAFPRATLCMTCKRKQERR